MQTHHPLGPQPLETLAERQSAIPSTLGSDTARSIFTRTMQAVDRVHQRALFETSYAVSPARQKPVKDSTSKDRVRERAIATPPATRIFLTSIPKSGTHFATAVLGDLLEVAPISINKNFDKLASLNRQFLTEPARTQVGYGHIRRDKRRARRLLKSWRIVVLIRDPRDVVLSMRDFLTSSPATEHRAAYETIAHLSPAEQIKAVILGIDVEGFNVAPINTHASGFLDWNEVGACVIRYEQFWEPASLDAFFDFLKVNRARGRDTVDAVRGMSSVTFNKGVVNRWREEMDSELLSFFHKHDGGCVERLGYRWD